MSTEPNSSTGCDTRTTDFESTETTDIDSVLGVSLRAKPYKFVLQNPGTKTDPFEQALALKRGIDDLPETRTMFELPEFDVDSQATDERVLWLLGSWRVPDRVTQNGTAQSWINPTYRDRRRYADLDVTCRCGTHLIRTFNHRGTEIVNNECDHSTECRVNWRLRARARVHERRAEIIKSAFALGHNRTSLAPRLGTTASPLGRVADKLQIDIAALAELARERTALTAADLLRRHDPGSIGEVFGWSNTGIRQLVDERTAIDRGPLRERRRQRAYDRETEAMFEDVANVASRTDGYTSRRVYSDEGEWCADTVVTRIDGGWADVRERAGLHRGEWA